MLYNKNGYIFNKVVNLFSMNTISIRFKMFIFSFVIVVFSVATSSAITLHNVANAFEKEFGARAIAIARTVSQLPDIQNNVGRSNGSLVIQPIAERIRLATNVDYIVVMDLHKIRYSHPSESKVGTTFTGGDEEKAFSQHEYISKAYGELGFAVRAFVPILDPASTKQVGIITVGIVLPKWFELLATYHLDFLMALFWGLLIGLIGSILVANHIKRQTLNLEPYEIARLVQERSGIIQAMDIGILATDGKGTITFINRLARQYTHFFGNNQTLDSLFENTWLAEEKLQRIETYRPLLMHKQMYLVRTFPIYMNEQNAGYLIMLTDRREANMLAEELTGIQLLVDSLRAQQHEFLNRLHSIAGLIQLNREEEALSLIIDEITDEEEIIQTLRNNIRNYAIQGLLLGKHSRAKELGIQLAIDTDSFLHDVMEGFSAGDIITILGNLLDNAMEACINQPDKLVTLSLEGDATYLYIEVADSGCGIEGDIDRIFAYGHSTKANEGRGIGLALIQRLVTANHGHIAVSSSVTTGTTITITTGGIA